MLKKRMLAYWNRVCPGCTLARKYPNSFIGKRVRAHWEKGCPSHKAYVELFEKMDNHVDSSPKKGEDERVK